MRLLPWAGSLQVPPLGNARLSKGTRFQDGFFVGGYPADRAKRSAGQDPIWLLLSSFIGRFSPTSSGHIVPAAYYTIAVHK
jgi:hypothetical protein